MIRYGFRDDGTIVFHRTPTSFFANPLRRFHARRGGYWRIRCQLGPEEATMRMSIRFIRYLPTDERSERWRQAEIRSRTTESFVDQDPAGIYLRHNQTTLGISKDRCQVGYDLVTVPQGITLATNGFADEAFTHHDFGSPTVHQRKNGL